MRNDYRSVYAAFDPHPSYKGASTHIHQLCDALAGAHPTLLLLKGLQRMEGMRKYYVVRLQPPPALPTPHWRGESE